MSKRDSEQRRKLKAWKADERAKAEAALPAPKERLLGLFHELDERLSATPCDHSLRFTMAWAARVGAPQITLARWVQENGGYCDCEVLANIPDTNEAFRR